MGGQRSCNACFPSLQLLPHVAILMLSIGQTLAADSLRKGGSIKDGETLVSQGNVFELGFFSPGASSSRYLGIWYKNISQRAVVWVGNRDKPITDTSGELTIDEEGKLMVLNGRGSPVVLASSPAAESPVALLLDSGNFVLTAASNASRVFWKSFDYPTDTLLPGMKLGLTGKQNRLLTSWRSKDDPSPGDFEFGFDPSGGQQLFIWQKGTNYWSSGLWNGQYFSQDPSLTNPKFSFLFFSSNRGMYLTYYQEQSSTILSRFVMDSSGQIKQLVWLENNQEWGVLWSQPRSYLCELPSSCGENGLCNNNSQPTCKCLPGFEPDSLSKWEGGDWSGGCIRRNKFACGNV